ncbi:unnamed protein product [marine sediment metagenome]|uniref:Uncharacterized protein n=1 Tax=marine sediment metagenome TaxID=412755 RepID=X1QTA1_9ZZZZ
MAIKNALRLRARKAFVAAALQTLLSEFVESGKIYCIQQAAWEIDTATALGNTRCRLYIEGHGYKHYLAEQDDPTAGKLYWYKEPVWLVPRERLALEIDHAAVNTTAEMHMTGYWTEIKEGIV